MLSHVVPEHLPTHSQSPLRSQLSRVLSQGRQVPEDELQYWPVEPQDPAVLGSQRQIAATQRCLLGQGLLQPSQWRTSVDSWASQPFLGFVSQSPYPSRHSHWLLLQLVLAGQALSQPPQCFSSEEGSTQPPPQAILGARQF